MSTTHGLQTFDASGNLLFDSRDFNLIYRDDFTIAKTDLGTEVNMNTPYNLAIFIEPIGAVGEYYLYTDLWNSQTARPGKVALACPERVEAVYENGNASIAIADITDPYYLADYRESMARVFHYGVAI